MQYDVTDASSLHFRVVHFRKESYANVVLSSGTIWSRRFLSA